MTEFVVELLEAIQVDHCDVDLVVHAPRALEFPPELLVPGATICKPGQLIRAGHCLDASQQLIALALGLLAPRDVADDARVQRVGIRTPGQDAELEWELAAVAATAAQLERAAGVDRVFAREQLLHVRAIDIAIALADQRHDGPPEHVVLGVSERPLSGGIELSDPAARVSGDYRVDRDRVHHERTAGRYPFWWRNASFSGCRRPP